jgi:predicted MFS family arabinose efflux permease
MRIAKPLLLITTPIGLALGLYEGWRLAGGLVVIMAALILIMGVAMGSVVWTIRRERAEEEKKKAEEEQALTRAARDLSQGAR